MKQSSPTHGAVFVQHLASDLLHKGFGEAQIFGSVSFGPEILDEDKPVLEFDQIALFFEHAARLTGEDTLGFTRGQVREMGRTGLICYVGLSAPTVMDFIKNIARYRRVFSDAVEIDVSDLESDGILRWHFNVSAALKRRQYVEFGASGLMHAMRRSANRVFIPRLVTFRHARSSNVGEFERYFGCDVKFGTSENAYHFRRSDLALPLMTADNHLYSVLRDYCEEILLRKARNVPPLVVEVERAIVDRLSTGEANQNDVARALGMSPRTLSRRLSEEGTTFFKTLEELRRTLAESYLKDSGLSLGEIAFLLGYSGLSSFNEAFKRWTGQTPGQFRTI